MSKRTLLVWVVILLFGFTCMPEIGSSTESKQAGKTELSKRKPKKKVSSKKPRKKKSIKKKKSYKYKYSKKKYKNKKKYSNKKSKKRYAGKKSRRTYRKTYTPSTNSSSVEYRNYKRNNDASDNKNIEEIAPQKEIRKEPKKEGEQ